MRPSSRRAPAALALVLAVAVLTAGCVTPPVDPSSDAGAPPPLGAWAERAIPNGDGHDHHKHEDHQGLTTPNFQVVGWDPLVSGALGKTAGSYYCGEVATTKDARRIAVVNSFDTEVAFVVVDVTDPAAPVFLGEYLLEGVQTYDVGVTPDGLHVAIGANPLIPKRPGAALVETGLALPGVVKVQPKFRDACTGAATPAGPEQSLPLAPALILVGIADPKAPVFLDAQPTPVLGPHSVSTAQIDSTTLVAASITNLQQQASYFAFYEVMATPLGARLVFLSGYQAPPRPGEVAVWNFHNDATIAKHPVTQKTIAYLADWDAGLILLDLSNPRVPIELGRWHDEIPSPIEGLISEGKGAIHGAYPLGVLWDDRHYTIVGQELGGHPDDRPSGWVYILDTTDPAHPVEAGRWTLPVDPVWGGFLMFSTHYYVVVERTLFVSMYHGGVWAIDLSTPEKIAAPPTIGAFVPDRVSPAPPDGTAYDEVLDVLAYPDGTLVAFSSLSGAYVLRFDADYPIVAAEPWPRA